MNGRWGYEDDELADRTPGDDADEPGELVVGRDSDGIVTIALTEASEVVSVKLKSGWRSAVDPRALHSNVLTAMRAAAAEATVRQAQQISQSVSGPSGTGSPPDASEPHADERPITREDAMRLLDAVKQDLDAFTSQLSSVAGRLVTVESGGGHVQASGQRQQLAALEIDAPWAKVVPDAEIESELRDALASFMDKSSIGELAQGPQSPAISELMDLVANPRQTIRRIRQR